MAVITGTAGADSLNGTASDDTISGLGNNDTLLGGGGGDDLLGGSGDDSLVGGAGDDLLDGGTGFLDIMIGGAGNDTYVVNDDSEDVIETAGGGVDEIMSTSISYQLSNYVENLTLTGNAHISGTGNTLGNIITGNTGQNVLDGGAGADMLIGGDSADTLLGGAGTDTLDGGAGADSLDGGTGADAMTGGATSDTYVVDNASDSVTEIAGGGAADLILSSIGLTLFDEVERLTLTGASNINGTGNLLKNTLTGNSGNNVLDGGAGADTLIGGTGNDTYVVNAPGELVTEDLGAGVDLVNASVSYWLNDNVEKLTLTGTNNIGGTGNDLNNTITGNSGNNVLNGGDGIDTLRGGLGNDTYVVGDQSEIVVEDSGAGTDLVQASQTYTLKPNVEKLTLIGDAGISGIGNTLDNTITGNSGNNKLDGRAGDDTLIGGTGNDIYTVDAAGDMVQEGAAAGTDIVKSSVTHTLDANVEKLLLTGTDAIDGTGNGLDNVINGNGQANLLSGLGGLDTLKGRGGDDAFIHDAADIRVDGGAGTDTLRVNGAGVTLDLTETSDAVHAGLEVIRLTGSGDNALVLALSDLIALSTTTDTLQVDGNAGDAVSAMGAWNHAQNLVIGAGTYAEYTNGAATLHVDLDVGRGDILLSALSLGVLDGTNGFRLDGSMAGDFSGRSVASAGDVNGDGFDDVIVGAVRATAGGDAYAGASYVVFGAASGFAAATNLSALDGTNGFRIDGIDASDFSGWSVGSGDFDGDGLGDLVIGAYGADADGDAEAGESYVLFGQSSPFSSSIDLSTVANPNGFRIDGIDVDDYSGLSVATAGDVNGDGFEDVIVGAGNADADGMGGSGETYVIFGKAFGAVHLDLTALNGANGFRLDGVSTADYSGTSVASAGDVNGDGFADIVVGAWGAGPSGYNYGASYVVFGKASGFGASLDLSALDGSNGFKLASSTNYENSGRSVASAGDVNGDGFDDMIVGANGYGNGIDVGANAGAAYVVFGGSAFSASLDLTALNGSNGFRLTGIDSDDRSGASVASAGDVNGDGYADLIVGAFGADSSAGEAYVVYGKATGFASSLSLSTLDGTSGFRLDGVDASDKAGFAVSSAGDVNGDGFDDLLVGAYGADETYVLFGGDFTGSVTFLGSLADDTLSGTGAAETFVAGQGHDIIYSGGGADVIRGGAGSEQIRIADAAFSLIDGGSGIDLLKLVAGDMMFDLTAIADNRLTSIEGIDLSDAGDYSVRLTALEVNNLVVNNTILQFYGGAGDRVITADGGWTFDGFIGFGNAQYSNGSAFLIVDADINRSAIAQSSYDLSALDGTTGFRIDGVDAGDGSGFSVASAGDVNGDGFDDVIVGAPYADASAGEAYIVFGKASGFASNIALSALDGTTGFRLDGIDADDEAGRSVSAAGDVNGDGFADLIIGARNGDAYGTDTGESYVVFGKATVFASSIALSSLNGTTGFRIDGGGTGGMFDYSGTSVSRAGDVNGDGFDDVIVGAPGAPAYNYGQSYVVFGKSSAFAASFSLSALDGTNGFMLNGVSTSDYSGDPVAAAGDVNGDGFDDLIVAAYNANSEAGESYVVFGGAGFSTSLDLSSLDGTNGFRLDGIDAGDQSGVSVASAGDVNGDGFDDLLVGAFHAGGDMYAGETYVVFGKSTFSASLSLSALDGTTGFRIDGHSSDDLSGISVSSAGDVNGDGYADLIIGASGAESGAGATYVVFGKASGFASSLDLGSLDGIEGFRLDGIDNNDASGRSVAGAGDVNGDGFDDLIVGAHGANAAAGESYVVFGADFSGAVTYIGTSGADSMTGSGAAETFVSGQGNDTVIGGGGADVFRTGDGNDQIHVANTGFADIDGGGGTDTLLILGDGRTLNLPARPNNEISGIERINLTGTGDNTLRITARDLFDLSNESNQVRVDGNAGDEVELLGTWTEGITDGTRTPWTLGAATILIDNDILIS